MKNKSITPTQKSLNLWAVILIVWSIYRTYFHLPEWFDEFIAKPVVFILPVLIYIKKAEKKAILPSLYINTHLKVFFKELLMSLGLGLLLLFTALFSIFLRYRTITMFSHFPSLGSFAVLVVTAIATGISEEIISRGFILKRLYDESKNAYQSTFLASILFFFLHIPILFTNPKINGSMLLVFMLTDLLLSMVNGLIMIQRKSLTVPIFIHAFYNVVMALALI